MTYTLSAMYTGGPLDWLNGLIVQSNYIALDGFSLAVFIILVMVMAGSNSTSEKGNFFIAALAVAIGNGLLSFAMGANGVSSTVLVNYSTRTLVWFAFAALALLWNTLGDQG